MSSESSDVEVNNDPANKRRNKNTEEWKRNKIPAKKATEEDHAGWKRQLVPKRATGPDCR
ncbi:hypothetical protein J6590_094929 [Homalodisca vitripennis]|nr:hypothetical protein J6590_094929 [Homalodisca vitripennis]